MDSNTAAHALAYAQRGAREKGGMQKRSVATTIKSRPDDAPSFFASRRVAISVSNKAENVLSDIKLERASQENMFKAADW